jgi:diketogulonate reductase-like aldo/keto reductase
MSFREVLAAAAKVGQKADSATVAFALGYLANRRALQQRTVAFSTLRYRLNDGNHHPAIGFGTYKCGIIPASAAGGGGIPADHVPATKILADAVDVGYRCFDCAQFYLNEADVGTALQKTGVPRKELYLISKVWCDNIYKGPEAVRTQVLRTLEDLQTDYIDLYLIHWPVPGKHVAAYLELEKLQQEGLLRSIGVSNYTPEDFEELMAGGATVVPAVNQIEINPFLHRRDAISFFKSKGVVMQAYRSLRAGQEHDNAIVEGIAAKHGKSPAQIMGAWAVQHGYVYVPTWARNGDEVASSTRVGLHCCRWSVCGRGASTVEAVPIETEGCGSLTCRARAALCRRSIA